MPQITLLHATESGIRTDMTCTACKLCETKDLVSNCLPGEGPPSAKIMFITAFPEEEEDNAGRLGTGTLSRLLREYVTNSGIQRSDVYFTNCVKCCPRETKIRAAHYEMCRAHLIGEINLTAPEILVAVGPLALAWLTGEKRVQKLRKQGLQSILKPELNVFVIPDPVIGSYRDRAYQDQVQNAIQADLRWIKDRMMTGELMQAPVSDVDYKMASTMEDVHSFLSEFEGVDEVCCDLETTSLFPGQDDVVVAIGFSKGPKHGRAIPLYAHGAMTLHFWSDDVLENELLPAIRKFCFEKVLYGHNFIQFDQKWLNFFNMPIQPVVFDTMFAHYMLDEETGTHGLEQLALKYTNMRQWKRSFTLNDIPQLCEYLNKDVDATSRVRAALEEQLNPAQKSLLKNLIYPLSQELMLMETRGVLVSTDGMRDLTAHLSLRMNEAMAEMSKFKEVVAFELAENTAINVDKPKHLAIIMEHYFKFPCIEKTGKGAYSTCASVLEALGDKPFVKCVLKIRGLRKLQGTYCAGMKNVMHKDGKLHTSFLVHGTVTGRLASREPNLQNIPREDTAGKVLKDGKMVKNVFVAEEGRCFLQADYSQAELRTLAMYSFDDALIEIFNSGWDVHTATAAGVTGKPLEEVTKAERNSAKSLNFGIIYGRSMESIIQQFIAAGQTRDQGKEFYYGHQKRFFGVWDWMKAQESIIRNEKYQETYFGRRRRYGYINDHAIRQAYNFPIQSTASDFTLFALVRSGKTLRELKLDAYPLLTVHDSIIFSSHIDCMWETAEAVKYIMENLNFKFMNVPMGVDMEAGLSWGNLKALDVDNRKIL